jgi:hypothetical protein
MYLSSISSSRFVWPVEKEPASTAPIVVVNRSALGGLEAFLERKPARVQNAQGGDGDAKSVFEAIGSEPFVAGETNRWLRTLTKQQYQGQAFEEMVTALARRKITDAGLETAIGDALASAESGSLGGLGQHTFLAILELHPDAGGVKAASYLDELVRNLGPTDLWKAVRLARCFAKRGQQERALSLYKWCGANGKYSLKTYRRSEESRRRGA